MDKKDKRVPSIYQIKSKTKISINDAWNQFHMALMLIVELKLSSKIFTNKQNHCSQNLSENCHDWA